MVLDDKVWLRVVITAVTNVAMVPVIRIFYQRRQAFECFIGLFTCVTSFLYHFCESIQQDVFLSAGAWHRLDNIASILAICGYILYLCNWRNQLLTACVQYLVLVTVLLAQESGPWALSHTLFPVCICICVLLVSRVIGVPTQTTIAQRKPAILGTTLLLLACLCFGKGLQQQQDPLRLWHGLWHCFVGMSMYYNFQIFQPQK